ncbi:MAG TPA: hypothetical protein VKU87_10115 [Thermomicrobiaceae bacterium]|nr:hypothetical protein [Thermomicrobiaceae bacterium]
MSDQAGGPLLAGTGRVDITPPSGIELFGYHRPEPMRGVHDPLSVTALALAPAGSPPLLILALDHIGTGRREGRELRRQIGQAAGTSPERVFLCFSHTHSGPDSERLDTYGVERPIDSIARSYARELHQRAVEASRLALANLRPARIGSAEVDCNASVNRRVRDSDGIVRHHGANPDGPVDRRMPVLWIEGLDGRPLASVVHFGIHGTALLWDNLDASADVAGALRTVVEPATGAPCLFLQGAAGDQNPRWRGDETALRRTGWELGGAALRGLAQASANLDDRPVVRSGTELADLPLRSLPDEADAIARAEEAERSWNAPAGAWLRIVRDRIARSETAVRVPIELAGFRLGSFLRIGAPLEPFAALSLAFRERLGPAAGSVHACLGGYTNGVAGYLPPAEELSAGGYEIEWMPAIYGWLDGWLMPPVAETADILVEVAVRLARRLL